MLLSNESPKPIYQQIAEGVEDDILTGRLKEGEQAYSTNHIAKVYQINPATAGKGINMLVDEDILFKRRGLGMFVADGAVERIRQKRKQSFYNDYLIRTLLEAKKLGIPPDQIIEMITRYEKGERP